MNSRCDVDPVVATSKLVDEVWCDVCEQHKPLHILSGHGKQRFDNIDNFAPQWGWKVRFSGRIWPQVCPDCMRLFEEYRAI